MTTLADFTRPRETVATRAYIAETARALDLDDDAFAEQVADHIAAEIERVGGSDARLVFVADDQDCTGPYCSWCWAIGGLCPHIVGGQSEHVGGDKEGEQ